MKRQVLFIVAPTMLLSAAVAYAQVAKHDALTADKWLLPSAETPDFVTDDTGSGWTRAEPETLEGGLGCLCGFDAATGLPVCWQDAFCVDVAPCGDGCPAGTVCVASNCCDPPLDFACFAVCPDGTACDNPGVCGSFEACSGGGEPKTYNIPVVPPGEIPDDDPVGFRHDFFVPDHGIILDLNVDLTITHTWVGDLQVIVEKKSDDGAGASVMIIDRPGFVDAGFGCNNDDPSYYVGILLDDEGDGGAIEDLCPLDPLTSPPNYTPNNALSAFDGIDKFGLWSITVIDNAGGDLGTLDSWSLHMVNDGGGPTSNCCEANPDGLPGCDCQACQDLVCGIDPFCCNTAWDGACAGAAADLCSPLCKTGEFDCEVDPVCGDGVVNQPSEQCDGSDDGACPGACQADCTCGEVCPVPGALTSDCPVTPPAASGVLFSQPHGGESALGIAIRNDGAGVLTIWVADLFSGNTFVYDHNLTPSGSFPHPTGLATTSGVAYDSANGTLWWLDADARILVEGDTAGAPTGNTIDCLPGGGLAAGVSYNANGDGGNGTFVYVDIGEEDVYEVDRGGNLVNHLPQSCQDNGGAVSGNGVDVNCGGIEVLTGDLQAGNPTERAVPINAVTGEDDGIPTELLAATGDIFVNDFARHPTASDDIMYVVGNATNTIYAVDPSDQNCANPACGPGNGDCCVPNGTPGCDNDACCEAICAIDPFCCDVEWDGQCAGEAAAEPLCGCGGPPVNDFLSTCGGPDGNFVQFGGGPEIPAIPADFFGPGSDPFVGGFSFEGNPFGPGDTDTVVRRPNGDPFDISDPPGASDPIPIEIVQLSLVSLAPITVTFNGGQDPEPWDVAIDLSVLPQTQGSLTATKTHLNGGTYDSQLPVLPRFTFTKVGDPGAVGVLDAGFEGIPPLQLLTTGAPWVHEANPFLNLITDPLSDFVVGVEETIPGDPFSQVITPTPAASPGGAVSHTICPATPISECEDADCDDGDPCTVDGCHDVTDDSISGWIEGVTLQPGQSFHFHIEEITWTSIWEWLWITAITEVHLEVHVTLIIDGVEVTLLWEELILIITESWHSHDHIEFVTIEGVWLWVTNIGEAPATFDLHLQWMFEGTPSGLPGGCLSIPLECPEGSDCKDGECVSGCGPCPTDVNGDGITGPLDLANLLAQWGPTFPGNCLDANGDLVIGPFDLATLLANWGPCP